MYTVSGISYYTKGAYPLAEPSESNCIEKQQWKRRKRISRFYKNLWLTGSVLKLHPLTENEWIIKWMNKIHTWVQLLESSPCKQEIQSNYHLKKIILLIVCILPKQEDD